MHYFASYTVVFCNFNVDDTLLPHSRRCVDDSTTTSGTEGSSRLRLQLQRLRGPSTNILTSLECTARIPSAATQSAAQGYASILYDELASGSEPVVFDNMFVEVPIVTAVVLTGCPVLITLRTCVSMCVRTR